MIISNTDWAYAAGFIDGDGHIAIYWNTKRGKRYPRLIVEAYNYDLKILEWLQSKFGGSIYANHSSSPKAHVWRPTKPVIDFIKGIEPYLISKKSQANLAIEYVEWIANTTKPERTDDQRARFVEQSAVQVAVNLA